MYQVDELIDHIRHLEKQLEDLGHEPASYDYIDPDYIIEQTYVGNDGDTGVVVELEKGYMVVAPSYWTKGEEAVFFIVRNGSECYHNRTTREGLDQLINALVAIKEDRFEE